MKIGPEFNEFKQVAPVPNNKLTVRTRGDRIQEMPETVEAPKVETNFEDMPPATPEELEAIRRETPAERKAAAEEIVKRALYDVAPKANRVRQSRRFNKLDLHLS